MSWRYAHTTEWRCDSCGVRKVHVGGNEPPDGWVTEHHEHVSVDYCPACIPPKEKP